MHSCIYNLYFFLYPEVFDIIGNRLKVTNKTNLSLRDYSKGIYLLKVAYGYGVEEIKVIKE